MKRIPEPELMNDEQQAVAYAGADFEEPHARFVALFQETFRDGDISGYVLDLGCGPGDIAFRFARAYRRCIVHGLDGAEAMLTCGRGMLGKAPDMNGRVEFFCGVLPGARLPRERYDVIMSNSLLHHLANPRVLWKAVREYAAPGAPVFVQDLMRPASRNEAQMLVERYSGNEPEILKRDFFNSLLAAFEPDEIRRQLKRESMDHLDVRVVSDRHVVISGYSV